MKTHHGWDYHRTRDGTYEWTDPRGTSYTTAPMPLHPRDPHIDVDVDVDRDTG